MSKNVTKNTNKNVVVASEVKTQKSTVSKKVDIIKDKFLQENMQGKKYCEVYTLFNTELLALKKDLASKKVKTHFTFNHKANLVLFYVNDKCIFEYYFSTKSILVNFKEQNIFVPKFSEKLDIKVYNQKDTYTEVNGEKVKKAGYNFNVNIRVYESDGLKDVIKNISKLVANIVQ